MNFLVMDPSTGCFCRQTSTGIKVCAECYLPVSIFHCVSSAGALINVCSLCAKKIIRGK